ncbi:MAG: ATPase, T2SS/T4P/T4SS family [Bryobacteraceae bacterium]
MATPVIVQNEQHQRLEVKLRRELGDQVLRLLDDSLTEDLLLNPDGSLWVKRMGKGFSRIGEMPAAQAASALETIAAWRGTVLNPERPILETELPIDGSRFEGIVSPVVRRPVFAIRLRPRKIFSLDDCEVDGILTDGTDPLNQLRRRDDVLDGARGQKQRMSHGEVIRAAVRARKNILVVGSTGSGKTTLVNAILDSLARLTPHDRVISIHDRVISIEDTTELQKPEDYVARVAFAYPEDDTRKWQHQLAAEQATAKQKEHAAEVPPAMITVEKINFDYTIRGGDEYIRPVRVFDDDAKTYIQMPPEFQHREAPVLLVVGKDGKGEMTNYRVKDQTYIVDRIFDRANLVLGSGKKAQKVEIGRGHQQ